MNREGIAIFNAETQRRRGAEPSQRRNVATTKTPRHEAVPKKSHLIELAPRGLRVVPVQEESLLQVGDIQNPGESDYRTKHKKPGGP